jgi:hypothetical protein
MQYFFVVVCLYSKYILSVERLISIPYKEKIIDACVTLPDVTKTTGYDVILTHGAGGDMNLLQLKLLSEHLASKGTW